MNTINYLEKAQAKLGLKRDKSLAIYLGITTGAVSQYKSGKRVIDAYTATKLAEVLGINPMAIIAEAEAEREKDEKKREFWRTLAQKMAGTAIILIVIALPIKDLYMAIAVHTKAYAKLLKRLIRGKKNQPASY